MAESVVIYGTVRRSLGWPWVTGVAVYAGRIAIDPLPGRVEDSGAAAVRNLFIGSPMWVAQV